MKVGVVNNLFDVMIIIDDRLLPRNQLASSCPGSLGQSRNIILLLCGPLNMVMWLVIITLNLQPYHRAVGSDLKYPRINAHIHASLAITFCLLLQESYVIIVCLEEYQSVYWRALVSKCCL